MVNIVWFLLAFSSYKTLIFQNMGFERSWQLKKCAKISDLHSSQAPSNSFLLNYRQHNLLVWCLNEHPGFSESNCDSNRGASNLKTSRFQHELNYAQCSLYCSTIWVSHSYLKYFGWCKWFNVFTMTSCNNSKFFIIFSTDHILIFTLYFQFLSL